MEFKFKLFNKHIDTMLVCVECGEQFEDFDSKTNYFICYECLLED